MTHVYRVATLNINGITSVTRLRMLEEFLQKHYIDLALLQEITHPELSTLRNYNVHINQGTESRETAILTQAGLTVTNKKRLPSGRRIGSITSGTWIVNIYAISGPERGLREKNLTPTTYHTVYRLQNPKCSSQATLTVYLKPMTTPDKTFQHSARKRRE